MPHPKTTACDTYEPQADIIIGQGEYAHHIRLAQVKDAASKPVEQPVRASLSFVAIVFLAGVLCGVATRLIY